MKKIIRLTESELKRIINHSIKKVLKESVYNNDSEILKTIIERITKMPYDFDFTNQYGELDVPLDNQNVYSAYISYSIDDSRYIVPGLRSHDRDLPDDPDDIGGDFDVIVNEIIIYKEGEKVANIQDNGMLADTIKSLADPEMVNTETIDDIYADDY